MKEMNARTPKESMSIELCYVSERASSLFDRFYKAKATAKAATKPSDAVVAAAPEVAVPVVPPVVPVVPVVPVEVVIEVIDVDTPVEVAVTVPTHCVAGVAPACGQWVSRAAWLPSKATPTW